MTGHTQALPQAASISGPRILLRRPHSGDRERLLQMYADPEVRRHLGGVLSPQAAHARVERHWLDPALDLTGRYVVALRDTDELLGTLVLGRRLANRPGHVRPCGTELELSQVLHRDAWGKGYAEEAVRTALANAAEELPDQPVVAVTATGNARTRRLTERLGFAESDCFAEFGAEQVLGSTALHSFRGPSQDVTPPPGR